MRRLAVLACLLLAGCARSIYSYTPTMEADPPELGVEGLALMNELGRAYTQLKLSDSKYCLQMLPSFQENAKYSYQRHHRAGKRAEETFKCIGYRTDAVDVNRHLQAGFALSTLYCHNYFRRIAQHANKRRFARSGINDAGAGVTTVLGLAAAGSGVTGGIGTGFALIDSLFRNYDDSFLVDGETTTLQANVYKKQDQLREDTYKKKLTSYADAEMAIRRHADYCSFTGMREIVSKALVRDLDAFSASDAAVAAQVDAGTIASRTEAETAKRNLANEKEKIAAETELQKLKADRAKPQQPAATGTAVTNGSR